jgi:hypothetical protein
MLLPAFAFVIACDCLCVRMSHRLALLGAGGALRLRLGNLSAQFRPITIFT